MLDIRAGVVATHAAPPADRRCTRTGKCVCVHRTAMVSSMRGQSGRSGEGKDSKTDKNAFVHAQAPLKRKDAPVPCGTASEGSSSNSTKSCFSKAGGTKLHLIT